MRPRSMDSRKRLKARLVLLLMAALGATGGLLATRRAASACDCPPFEWRVQLQETTSSDPAANHQSFWPAQGTLSAYLGHANIWSSGFVPGVIARAGAGR